MVSDFGGVFVCEKASWLVPRNPRIKKKKKMNESLVFIDLTERYSLISPLS
jgi:hypothetical protein